MQCEAPDTHFYADIRDLNLEFIGLVAAGRGQSHGRLLGLEAAVVDQISRLGERQLEAMAAMPCLLATFGPEQAAAHLRAAEPAPAADPHWIERTRLFAAGLLAYLRQASRGDALRAALCLGHAGPRQQDDPALRDLCNQADHARRRLQARFYCSPRFWPDLVRAARDGERDRLQLVRLTAIQLASAEALGAAPYWSVMDTGGNVLAVTR